MEDAKMESVLPSIMQNNSLVKVFRDIYYSFSDRRAALGLSNPGTVDNIAKEVQKDVFLTNAMFSGMRADFTRPISVTPLFQYSHAFAMGSQGIPPYNFSALYGTPKVFLQGNLDSDKTLMARANYRWNEAWTTKCNAQIASGANQAMLQIDNDITGKDYTVSLKSINPSIIEGGLTGIFLGSYLQAMTPGLALGFEAMWQRQALNQGPDTVMSYCAKYKGSDWIASAQLQAQGALNTSFWKRLTDKVEAGVDMNLQIVPSMGGGGLMGYDAKKEGTTTVGAKYDFRASTFRAQLDSNGKLSCLLEKRVLPPLQITFAGEMDHFKNTAKVGLAVSIELATEEIMATAGPDAAPAVAVPF